MQVRARRGQRGLSLVEVTIMLLVLMLLTSVLAPSIFDFVKDAQWVKVKEDCEAIGVTVARMMRDVPSCLRVSGTTGCTVANKVELLVSDGSTTPTLSGEAGNAYNESNATNLSQATLNWGTAGVGNWGTMEAHFVRNLGTSGAPAVNPSPAYPLPSALPTFPVGPQFGLGWRGAYLSSPIGPDPWGTAYMVNTVFLTPGTNATDCAVEGCASEIWDRDVFCISAGPNQTIETYFGGCDNVAPVGTQGTCRRGDDFVYVIQGSTR